MPAWLRHHPVFRFFASLHLALILLAVIIVASVFGTIYESRFTAEVARAYVYEAWWFDLWLLLLAANLATVAFSRMPWKKSHTGFLLTHLGIILILAGAYVGKTFGIEGSVTLFKGQPPVSQMLINQRELRIGIGDTPQLRLPASVLGRLPTPERPLRLGTFQGWQVEAIGFADRMESLFRAEPSEDSAAPPALQFTLLSPLMGQPMQHWLWSGDESQATLDLGMARIRLQTGNLPPETSAAAPPRPVDLQESIFTFAKLPGEQVSKVQRGGATGATLRLETAGDALTLRLELGGASHTFRATSAELPRTWPIPSTRLQLTLKEYWPDFQLVNNQPVSRSNEPLNPAILVELTGTALPASAAPAAHGSADDGAPPNRLDLYATPEGTLAYHLHSSQGPARRGFIRPGESLATGWADWTFTTDRFLPHAFAQTDFRPMPEDKPSPHSGSKPPQGLLVRLRKDAASLEEWVPQGWLIQTPSPDGLIRLSYGFKTAPLPFALQLKDFHVERYPGSTNPAEFRSTLTVLRADGGTDTGSCSMNQPFNHPGGWWRAWTGLTYKMSQAGWNPDNLGQSSIQILRDPGWLLKWTGSLVLCLGIFALFYLRPPRGDLRPDPPAPGPVAAGQQSGAGPTSPASN
jgi:hypothetical protein